MLSVTELSECGDDDVVRSDAELGTAVVPEGHLCTCKIGSGSIILSDRRCFTEMDHFRGI